MGSKTKSKKFLNILSTFVCILAVAILALLILSVFTLGKGNMTIFGYKAYIVRTDSMQEHFSAGDIIFTKVLEGEQKEELEAGDIITFVSKDLHSYNQIVTHMIRVKYTEGDTVYYITYGTTTDKDDFTPVLSDDVIGVYQAKIPKVGHFFSFLQTPTGYVVIIVVPFVVIISMIIFNLVKTLKSIKKDKQIQEENNEKMSMQKEIEELKAKLLEKENQGINTSKDTNSDE